MFFQVLSCLAWYRTRYRQCKTSALFSRASSILQIETLKSICCSSVGNRFVLHTCVSFQANDDSLRSQIEPNETGSRKEKFEVYEQQLLTLSLSNAKLNEENDNLR